MGEMTSAPLSDGRSLLTGVPGSDRMGTERQAYPSGRSTETNLLGPICGRVVLLFQNIIKV